MSVLVDLERTRSLNACRRHAEVHVWKRLPDTCKLRTLGLHIMWSAPSTSHDMLLLNFEGSMSDSHAFFCRRFYICLYRRDVFSLDAVQLHERLLEAWCYRVVV